MGFLVLLIAFVAFPPLGSLGGYVVHLPGDRLKESIMHYEICPMLFHVPSEESDFVSAEYEKAAEMSIKGSLQIVYTRINCTDDENTVCSEYDVEGESVIKIFKHGNYLEDYKGPLKAKDIVTTIRSHVEGLAKQLKSEEEVKGFIESERDGAVLGFFEKDTDLERIFFEVSDELRRDFRFGYASQLDSVLTGSDKETVVVYRPPHMHSTFEEPKVSFNEEPVQEKLKRFIISNYFGLVGHRTAENQMYFKNPLVITYYHVDYDKNRKHTNYWRNRILKVAKIYQDDFNFAISDANEFEDELRDYNLNENETKKPVVIAMNAKGQRFTMKEPFSSEALEKFIKAILSNKIEPEIKSEPVPVENEGLLKKVVAKNFDDIVANSNKDIFLEFYAPWCGYCKRVAPTLEMLAKKLDGEEVDLVKMDATQNDVPASYNVEGYPTFYWIGRNSKQAPKRYLGGTELDDFLKYIAKEATKELQKYDRNGVLKDKKDEL